jgi:hypothetical protein
MNEKGFRNANEFDDFVCNIWSEVTLEEVQLVFHEWMRRLEWVSQHDREYVREETS